MKKIIISLLLIIIIFSSSYIVMAGEPYQGYNYNSWGLSEPAPNAYKPSQVINANTIGISSMSSPSDIFYLNDKIYILDSGNSRIIVLDNNFKLIRLINTFLMSDGSKTILSKPLGIYVCKNNNIIIADTGNNRVLVCDQNGLISDVINKPQSDIFPKDIEFKPKRVIADRQNNIYVLCDGFYYGAIVYDINSKFTGFFGANKVEVSFAQASDMFWRMFMTKTQKKYVAKYVPVYYSSFDIDNQNFIYTCDMQSQSSLHEIKKLNAMGNNILNAEITYDPLNKSDYGDKEKLWYKGNYIDTKFVDIDIADDGVISALDYTYGKIFQYDQESNLMCVFGGMSDQVGTFKVPTSIENVGENVLVLDSDKANIYVFTPTEYGKLIRTASTFYNDGQYSKALTAWNNVLKQDCNSELAYSGIGRAYLQQGDYIHAMEYLKSGQDRSSYSEAFKIYRSDVVKKYFGLIAVCIIALLLLIIFLKKIIRKTKQILKIDPDRKNDYNIFSVVMHPINGMEDLRLVKGKMPIVISLIILSLWFIVSMIERQETGFIFNTNRLEDFNIYLMFAKTFGMFILFLICSWAVGSLNEGEGTFIKLFIVTGYSILPYVTAVFIKTVASNFIIYEEGTLFTWIVYIGLLYSLFLLFTGVRVAHQYSVVKTIVSLILTLICIIIVLLIMVLIFSLVQQLYIFVMTVYNELMFRM